MPPICPDDHQNIEHINYVTGRIHDLGTELYESLMDRDHGDAKAKAQELTVILNDLVECLTEDI